MDTKEETELAKNYSIEIVPNMTFFSNGIAEKHYTGKATYVCGRPSRLVPVRNGDLGFASLCM